MELISWFIDLVLHLDKHLTELVANYHLWVYAIIFLIVFCVTTRPVSQNTIRKMIA